MRIAITGGRDRFPAGEELYRFECRLRLLRVTEVLHGDCRGTDRHVAKWLAGSWIGTRIKVTPVAVDHAMDGPWPGAGPRRNGRMLDMGVEALVAFQGGRGTADCVRQARAKGIPVYFVKAGDKAGEEVERGE